MVRGQFFVAIYENKHVKCVKLFSCAQSQIGDRRSQAVPDRSVSNLGFYEFYALF